MLPHLAARLFGTPLLVHRAKLDVILAVLGERLNLAAPAADLAIPVPRVTPAQPSGIAVIPIHGTLVKRALGVEAASGLTSYTEIAAQLDAEPIGAMSGVSEQIYAISSERRIRHPAVEALCQVKIA